MGVGRRGDQWEFPKNSGTPKWMVYKGNPLLKWMIWGYHHLRKHPNGCTVSSSDRRFWGLLKRRAFSKNGGDAHQVDHHFLSPEKRRGVPLVQWSWTEKTPWFWSFRIFILSAIPGAYYFVVGVTFREIIFCQNQRHPKLGRNPWDLAR